MTKQGAWWAAVLALSWSGCCDIPPSGPGASIAQNTNSYIPELRVATDRLLYVRVGSGMLATSAIEESSKVTEQERGGGDEKDAGARYSITNRTPSRLFVTGKWVTWFEEGMIARREVAGSLEPSRRDWKFLGGPLAVDADDYFFEDQEGLFAAPWGTLHPKKLCAKSWLFLSPFAALDAAWLYVAPYESTDALNKLSSVARVARAGGSLTTLASKQPGMLSLAVDDKHVYWAATGTYEAAAVDECPNEPLGYEADGVVGRVFKSGGTPVILAQGLRWPKAIEAGGDYVYWVSDGRLQRVAKAGGEVQTVIAGSPIRVAAFALDGKNIFWSTNYGTIRRLAI